MYGLRPGAAPALVRGTQSPKQIEVDLEVVGDREA